MKRFCILAIIAVVLCIAFILGDGAGNKAIAGDKCVQRDSITATGDYLRETGEWHYPCGNRADLRATYIVTSDPPPHPARMWFKLEGGDWRRDANLFSGSGEKEITGIDTVSIQTQYRLAIGQYIGGAGFESPATFRVYYNYTPN